MSGDELDPVALAIKAVHAEGGQPLTKDEAIAFLARPIYLGRGMPPVPEPGRRGPKPKKTPYDIAHTRRADLWRRLVLLPKNGEDGPRRSLGSPTSRQNAGIFLIPALAEQR
jgi:hypothetical protein